MIEVKGTKLNINGTHLSFPIRIKQVLEIEELIIVCIAYDYTLDVGLEWNKGGKEKWHEFNSKYKQPTLFCFDKLGCPKWEFGLNGYVDIIKLDEEIIKNDLRIQSWINNNPDKKNLVIVQHEDRLIVDYKTGEIYQSFEMR